MAVEVETIGSEALGPDAKRSFVDAAIDAVRDLAKAEPAFECWLRPFERAIARGRLKLPALATTTQRIVSLIESPDVSLDDLADAVAADPVLTMRLIGVANSAYFRGATEVPNIRDALMRMGVREARTIIVVVALRSTVLRSQGLGDAAQILWRHSLLSAVAAQEITREIPPWETLGFLAGLLHDIGKLVTLSFVAELPAWQEDGEGPSDATVERMLEATHASLGATLLSSWGFPDVLCEAVLAHHNVDAAPESVASLVRAIELAHSIANQLEAGWPDDPEELDASLRAMGEGLGLGLDRLCDLAQETEANFEALNKLN